MKDLEKHLPKIKQDGFSTLMCVQFGYYAEIERVTLYTADLAEKYGIKLVAPFGGLLSAWDIAPDADARFTEIINKMRQHYSGEIISS